MQLASLMNIYVHSYDNSLLGHVLLVGASGSGKTLLAKFSAWLHNMTVIQIKVDNPNSPDNLNNTNNPDNPDNPDNPLLT